MKPAPDFSPTIRVYTDAQVLTLAQLAHVGGISRTQAHRQYHAARAIAGGHLTPDTLAEQQRFSAEEETLNVAGFQLFRRLSHG